MNDMRWAEATIAAYRPVPDDENWRECPRCGVRPRQWIYDNGRFAKCLCRGMYDPAMVEAESILSVLRRTGSTEEYDRDGLRKAWNIWACSLASGG